MIFGRSTRNTHIYDEILLFLKIRKFHNNDRRNIIQNPTEIQYSAVSSPSATFKYTIPIDENHIFGLLQKIPNRPKTGGAQIGPKSKNKNRISFGNIKQNAAFQHRFGGCVRRFCFIFSTNIENLNFLPRADFEPSTTDRFE